MHHQLKTLPANSAERKKIENELNTYYPITDGKMILKANPSFLLYDFYGNAIAPKNGIYEIPLNYQGYYMRVMVRREPLTNLYRPLVKRISWAMNLSK